MKKLLRLTVFLLAFFPLPGAKAQSVDIAAIVNDDMISSLDVENRLAFLLETSGRKDSPEVHDRLARQVVESLINESLQMQEAKKQKVTVNEDEIKASFAQINAQRHLPPGSFEHFIAQRHLSEATVKDQIRAQLAWSKVVAREARGDVRITDHDVEQERIRLAAGQDVTEYNISSILLPVTDKTQETIISQQANALVQSLRSGQDFALTARQYSAGNPDLVKENQGLWVQLHQLDPLLAETVQGLSKGQVSDPVRTQGGYQILKFNDQRTSNTAQMRDSEVLLKEITMRLKPAAENQEATVLLDIAKEVAKHPGSCQEKEVAGLKDLHDLEFDVKMERVGFRDVQPDLQDMLTNLRVGDISEPYAAPDGIHLVMLCEKVDKPINLPPADIVREKLFRERIAIEAEKIQRDLRREAFIEIR